MEQAAGAAKLCSLPHRQLRNFGACFALALICSLPHRQLRKRSTYDWVWEGGSLPHRQLRNDAGIEKNKVLETFQVNIGIGLHYKITNNLAVQLDWRHYYSSTKTSEDNTIVSRIVYLFGKGER